MTRGIGPNTTKLLVIRRREDVGEPPHRGTRIALKCLYVRYPKQRVTVTEARSMANKGPQQRLGATDSGSRPGCFPIGSPLSRAAARAMLAAREASDDGGLCFQVVSVVDGKSVNLGGLAGRLRAAIDRNEVGELPALLAAGEGGPGSSSERGQACLSERMRRAQERLEQRQGRGST